MNLTVLRLNSLELIEYCEMAFQSSSTFRKLFPSYVVFTSDVDALAKAFPAEHNFTFHIMEPKQ